VLYIYFVQNLAYLIKVMSFKIENYDNYTLISFTTDKLDAIVAPDLKSELVVIAKQGNKNILLDLASVKYCDSSGLSALLIGNRVCNELNGYFIISSLQTAVKKLITISQLNNILSITPTLTAAIDLLFEKEVAKDKSSENLDE